MRRSVQRELAHRSRQQGCRHLARVVVSTTVRPKAVAFPTGSKLRYRALPTLVEPAKEQDVPQRKVTKTRRSFPNDESVLKVLYLALHEISKKWTMPTRDWKRAMSQFMILFGDRASL